MRAFPVKAIDDTGKRWQFDQLAFTLAEAERLALDHIGNVRYLFVRRAAA